MLNVKLLATESARTAGELARVAAGSSRLAPARGDRRFGALAFKHHPVYRRLMQSHLAVTDGLHRLVDGADLHWKTRERAHFGVTVVADALAPTNTLLGNPTAVTVAYETAGASLLNGARHALGDLRRHGGMPAMVDTRPFRVGQNLAVSPGAVVHRSDVFELIQYAPTTDEVFDRPLLVVPPQINKFYALDLAPGRSFVEWATAQGVPVFTISWRNPTAAQRHWGLDTYVAAAGEAARVAADVTGAEQVDTLGVCAGGLTMAMLLMQLAERGDPLVRTATFGVTALDPTAPSLLGALASRPALAAARARSARRGVLDGRDMARVFAWLRPNDLVWSYWVNNYLCGNEPPAFDVLYWNDDATRLPARLHADLLDLAFTDEPPPELRKIDCDTYVVAGMTDHIVPWEAAWRTTQLVGGRSTFVLSSSGHIQSLVNPPGNPKARYFTGDDRAETAEAWRAGAIEETGSWWPHWRAWLSARSDGRRPAPATLGGPAHPALDPAPGRYVHER